MKYALTALAAVSFACALPNHASSIELSENFQAVVNVGALSEYVMRGISYSQRTPVAQGSVILMHSSGAYIGLWASNLDIRGLKADYESDYLAGYLWQINDQVSLDLGYIKYTYPDSSYFNVSESYGVLTAYNFKLGTYYSSDGGLNHKNASQYTYVGYGTKDLLPLGLGLDVRYGLFDLKDSSFFSKDGHTQDKYQEWEAKISKSVFGVDFAASYIDTNLSKTQCRSYVGDNDSCSARLLLAVTKTF